MARIKVDLHDIYNNSAAIDRALQQAFNDAIDKKIREVEIIPGKGSGQLRKKVERFLQQPHIKQKYHRIENDSKNFGRLFVYFKFWKFMESFWSAVSHFITSRSSVSECFAIRIDDLCFFWIITHHFGL